MRKNACITNMFSYSSPACSYRSIHQWIEPKHDFLVRSHYNLISVIRDKFNVLPLVFLLQENSQLWYYSTKVLTNSLAHAWTSDRHFDYRAYESVLCSLNRAWMRRSSCRVREFQIRTSRHAQFRTRAQANSANASHMFLAYSCPYHVHIPDHAVLKCFHIWCNLGLGAYFH